MNEAEFETKLREDGYDVARRDLDPGHVAPEHDHPWDTRGMVLEGEFTVVQGGESRSYAPGEVFDVPAGVAHRERHGAGGGRILFGRRKKA